MNLPVDVEPRMKINREKRKLGENMRQHEREEALKAAGGMSKSLVPADRVPLRFINVGFSYGVHGGEQSELSPPTVALSGSNCQISQGRMVCIVGPRSQGKSTFMKLLGGVLLPQNGTIFTPPWLRVLHVSQEPVFFEGTLLDNLVIGVNPDDVEDSDPGRVARITERLGLQSRILTKITATSIENWDEVLSRTQKLLLNVARALIANPEVLVMHSPAVHLDRTNAEKVFTLLREFVDKKGLEQDPTGWRYRRPRTCVITSNRIDGVHMSDHVFLCQNKAVTEIRKDSVAEEMLM
jgi:ABC-type multidrug transport system fused ATPase/permease subunit